MSVADEIIARLERRQAANTLRGVRNESELICPHCGYQGPESEFDYADDSGDDADKWETSEEAGRTDGDDDAGEGDPDDYNDRKNSMNKPQLTPEQKLARALLESAQRNSTKPRNHQVNRPAQRPSAQRAQVSQAPLAEENAALVLARAIAELRKEKR